MALTKIKGFFTKYFTPTNIIIGLVILSSVVIYTGCNTRAKLVAVRSELAASQTLNTIVEAERIRLDDMILVYKDSLTKRDIVISAKDKKIVNQLGEIVSLQDALKNTLIDLGSVTAETSYRYINQRIMPRSERIFPFDSVQVKAIHYTFIERDGLIDISNKQNVLIKDLSSVSSLKDNQISDLNSLVNVYVSKDGICKKENDAYKIEITGLNKSVKQQKFLKTILLPPAAVGVIMVALKILVK